MVSADKFVVFDVCVDYSYKNWNHFFQVGSFPRAFHCTQVRCIQCWIDIIKDNRMLRFQEQRTEKTLTQIKHLQIHIYSLHGLLYETC